MPATWRGWPSRLARANAAVEVLADGAERYLALGRRPRRAGRNREFRCRGLCRHARGNPAPAACMRAIDRFGHEGPAELGKVEALLAALDRPARKSARRHGRPRLKQTLAGALISLAGGRIRIEPAPPRRRRTTEASRSGELTGTAAAALIPSGSLNHP